MVEISLITGWTEREHVPHVRLLGDLVTEYASSRPPMPVWNRKSRVFSSIDGEMHDQKDPIQDSVVIRMIPLEHFKDFASWCRSHGVAIDILKAVRADGVPFPGLVTIDAPGENPMMCMSVLRHG